MVPFVVDLADWEVLRVLTNSSAVAPDTTSVQWGLRQNAMRMDVGCRVVRCDTPAQASFHLDRSMMLWKHV